MFLDEFQGPLGIAFGQEVAVEALVEALADPAWWVGEYAMDALVAVGGIAAAPTIGALERGGPIVRRRAADVLGLIGDWQATATLIKAVRDEEAWVRTRAVQALGLLGDPHAIPALQKALRDEDRLVVRAAVEALGQLDADGQTHEMSE